MRLIQLSCYSASICTVHSYKYDYDSRMIYDKKDTYKQVDETHNPVRFLRDPNELGKSPEKLLYDKSLEKMKCHNR